MVIFVRASPSASVESVVMMDAVAAVVLVPPRLAPRPGCANVIYVPFKIASAELMAAATLMVVELVASAVVRPISPVFALQIALEKRAVVMVVVVAAVVAYRLKFVPLVSSLFAASKLYSFNSFRHVHSRTLHPPLLC